MLEIRDAIEKEQLVKVNVASDFSVDKLGKDMQTTVTHSDITALKEGLRKLQVMKDAVDREVQKLKGNVEEFAMSQGSSLNLFIF